MSTQPTARLTPEEYLVIERAAETRSEYLHGEMFAMSGGSSDHNTICGNFYSAIRGRPRGNRRTYLLDMRVRVSTDFYTYPDIAVVSGERHFADSTVDTLLNPTLIAEVFSPSSERYDRGRKFEQFRNIPSLLQYVLVSQDHVSVEVFTRQSKIWLFAALNKPTDLLELESIAFSIPVAELYVDVDFPAAQL